MAACLDSGFWLRAIGAALALGVAGCSGTQTTAATGAEASALTVCNGATSEPKAKWLSQPDFLAVASPWAAANRTRWRPISAVCGTMRFVIAADGKVQDTEVLEAYPKSAAMRDGWVKFMAPVTYPASAAGGPYVITIVVTATRVHQ